MAAKARPAPASEYERTPSINCERRGPPPRQELRPPPDGFPLTQAVQHPASGHRAQRFVKIVRHGQGELLQIRVKPSEFFCFVPQCLFPKPAPRKIG